MTWINNNNKQLINLTECRLIFIKKTYICSNNTCKMIPLFQIVAMFDFDEDTAILEEFFNEKEAQTYLYNLYQKIQNDLD